MPWSLDEVEERLKEAADVLRRLPDPDHGHLYGSMRAHWPVDMQYTSTETFAVTLQILMAERKRYLEAGVELPTRLPSQVTPIPRVHPQAEEIARMEQVVVGNGKDRPWLMYVPTPRRKLVWRRVSGMSWWNIAAMHHKSERTVQRWYKDALATIAHRAST